MGCDATIGDEAIFELNSAGTFGGDVSAALSVGNAGRGLG